MSNRVFILEPVKFSLQGVESFGELLYVFGKGSRRCSVFDQHFGEVVIEQLETYDYDPGKDFLLVTGKVVALSVSVASIAAAYGQIRLLLFSANLQKYIPRTIGEGLE
ncbi:hypothetical protein LCGC14_0357440 [marine sediment metagenome]|uniref:Uncharacterized protein n=1 Tax=marine sediment metagenome TaxID=412755 RepID=A0A0F9T9A8_9ZZZZ